MYLIGHCWMTELSRAFREEDIYDDGLLMLMMPDYAECHDWAFTQAWKAPSPDMRLVQAHMLADWYVHFGDTYAEERKKTGWAYRSMRPATKLYKEFYGRATAVGLRRPDKPADSVRGFSHTMLEYAIDTHIARKGVLDDKFDRMKRTLDQLTVPGWLTDEWERLGVWSDGIEPVGAATSYHQRTWDSREPAEVAYYAGARKFGLHECRESVEYVGRYIDKVLAELDPDELDQVTLAVAESIGDPDVFGYVDSRYDITLEPEEK